MELNNSTLIALSKLESNKGQLEGLPENPRQINRSKLDKLVQSIKDNPEMLALRELLVYEYRRGRYVVIGGNMRLEAMKAIGYTEAPCKVIPEGTTVEQLKAYTIKDNAGFGEWDWDLLANEWDDMPLEDWGIDLPVKEDAATDEEETMSEDEIERKEREFKERMAAGEIDETDEEYQQFLDKFKPKKTTDDCYTPDIIYDAVARWVMDEYGVDRRHFERPFYPGGDYKRHTYTAASIVVDNPPFSIIAEILDYYNANGIKFFLFAPTLTLFSSSSSRNACAISVGAKVTYENGANVNTSFLTNLEPPSMRLRSAPSLYRVVEEANDENLKAMHKELPKYSYPRNVVTATMVAYMSKYGEEFGVTVAESCPISELDMQKEQGKAIYGKGYLISNTAAAEKAAAEKAAAEKAAATQWALSDREREIILKLSSPHLAEMIGS